MEKGKIFVLHDRIEKNYNITDVDGVRLCEKCNKCVSYRFKNPKHEINKWLCITCYRKECFQKGVRVNIPK